ncbi:MAG: hypothetical protein H0T73_19750 [Ardenticatenales bacterium]|nr:hypothetical protein [Ardenticatenales bacterium]
MDAIHAVDSTAIIVHVEAAGLSRSVREDLEALAVEEQRRGYLGFDLLTGKVTPRHPLFPWLVRHGASPDDLAALAARRLSLDIMGLNFYPQWSIQQFYIDPKGKVAQRAFEASGEHFAEMIRDYYNRYQIPILITETSAVGPDEVRLQWLNASIAAIKQLRSEGIPVYGYTWFPLFTMIDWRYRLGNEPVEHYRLDLGLYTLANPGSGARWSSTPLVETFCHYVAHTEDAIGPLLAPSHS